MANISQTIKERIGISDLDSVALYGPQVCNANMPRHFNVDKPTKKVLTELYLTRQYLSIAQKKVCHAHSTYRLIQKKVCHAHSKKKICLPPVGGGYLENSQR